MCFANLDAVESFCKIIMLFLVFLPCLATSLFPSRHALLFYFATLACLDKYLISTCRLLLLQMVGWLQHTYIHGGVGGGFVFFYAMR